jgi:cupin fold WbuC family metalloprotein
VQRLFIALEPETYIRPHRHSEPPRWEFFVLIRGAVDALSFSDEGVILERIRMTPGDAAAVEVPPATWHSYLCLESGTVVLEVKEGPYAAPGANNFANWAPDGDPVAIAAYLERMRRDSPQA